MKIVKVTYTTKAAYTAQNKINIAKVMDDLQSKQINGLNYTCCLGADGKSFIHFAFFNSPEDEKVLAELESFKNFQKQLKAEGLETQPVQEVLTFVGSSTHLFSNHLNFVNSN